MPADLHSDYDFIIVGSGPAGCVLANRLSENPEINVLLLEAGPRPTTVHSVPALSFYSRTPATRWNHTISPYPGSCLAYKGQQCDYYLGRVLGGSTAVNNMMYVRGNRHDFDRWERMGNYGWGFGDLLPLFLKLENATQLRHDPVDASLRGLEGELDTRHSDYKSSVVDNFFDGLRSRGLSYLDYNAANQIGFDLDQSTIRNGRRLTAADAYLAPVKHRRNLHVMINSLVSRIIIDPVGKAEGVEFVHRGESYLVYADKEVVVSAGPINSPQLLMLSGIGPREDLTKLGIPVLADLPVGRKYVDHYSLGRLYVTTNTSGETINLLDITDEDVEVFVKKGSGRLSLPGTREGLAFVNDGMDDLPQGNPNLEILFSIGKNEEGYSEFTGLRDDVYGAVFLPLEKSDIEVLCLNIFSLYPKSRGSVRLRGNTINHQPIIDFPFFEDPRDMAALLRGIRELEALIATPAMRRLDAKLHSIPLPDCAKLAFASDDYWRCYVRHMTRNIYHAAATVKMGPRDDPEAVVDPELRVYGVENLRVADSSIAPTQTASHTQAISYLVGEKLAGLIKKKWDL